MSGPARSALAPPSQARAASLSPWLSPERGPSFGRSARLQTKLSVSRPGDSDEREADRLADAVLTRPVAAPKAGCAACAAHVQRKCAKCEDEEQEQRAQRKASTSAPVATARTGDAHAAPAGTGGARDLGLSGGRALAADVRGFFEPRFGHDFGHVRIHTDSRAAEAAGALAARAFTIGSDVAFAPGEYRPHSHEGRRLLAHELAHVIQQSGGAPARVRREPVELPPTGIDQRYPGCTDPRSRALQYEIDLARVSVNGAIAALEQELASIQSPSPGAGIITMAGSALAKYFKTRNPAQVKTIVARLRAIGKILARGPGNWVCTTQASCAQQCSSGGSTAAACAGTTSAVLVCSVYFTWTSNHVARSMVLVHETAHQAGLGGDTYEYTKQFPGLTTSQAMVNADSYAYFVQDLALGGVPQTNARARPAMPDTWSPLSLSITFNMLQPSLPIVANVDGFGEQHGSVERSRLRTRAQGRIVFFTDLGGDPAFARGGLFRAPRIEARITLRRRVAGGRVQGGAFTKPEREVLFEQKVSEATYRGAGHALGPDFNFDLHFDKADRGELIIEAWLNDLETNTRRELRESFDVAP
jgi:hypothetical protein